MSGLAFRRERKSEPPTSGIRVTQFAPMSEPILGDPKERTFGERVANTARGALRVVSALGTTLKPVKKAVEERTPVPPEVAGEQLGVDGNTALVYRLKKE